MQKKLYILHHSHTDIGYTEMQNRIERWQVDFIRQALSIIKNQKPSDNTFRWNCEAFWVVEKFLKSASEKEKTEFANAVKSGNIGLSASYLNFNELIGDDVMRSVICRSISYAKSIGYEQKSAMTADINGYNWGFSEALHDAGVNNLFSCVHTHHGMYPANKKQSPFYWETPEGNRILVWNGEHYHFGNELGVVPDAVSSYMTKDECDAEMIFNDFWGVAKIRIPRYFEKLENEGYPYDFVPVMASGLRHDNASPSGKIVEMINRWNSEYGDEYLIEMQTLDGFFEILRKSEADIPLYRGDWPDWWSDGYASQPIQTRLFRQAQRNLEIYNSLIEHEKDISRIPADETIYNLAMYAEHTFSHSFSMLKPSDFMVHAVSERKNAFASLALDGSNELLDSALSQMGATELNAKRGLKYKVVNPTDHQITDIVGVLINHFEYWELNLDKGLNIVNVETGEKLKFQCQDVPPGIEYLVQLDLAPHEETILEVIPVDNGIGGLIKENRAGKVDFVETEQTKIEWEIGRGIVSWIDKNTGKSLLREDRNHDPFSLVYEISPIGEDETVESVRGAMGLNRKGKNVERSVSRLVDVKRIESGPVYERVELEYEVEGCKNVTLALTMYHNELRAEATLSLNKENSWEPENLYLALPFSTPSQKSQLWLDRAGAIMRPRIDQIPGTLIDFYTVQSGFALVEDEQGMAISMLDNGILQVGDLEFGDRKLHGPEVSKPDKEHLYAWLMTNYWETNFAAGLGGFHEFRFCISWGNSLNNPEMAIEKCNDLCKGLTIFRLGEKK
jgi:Glycosyl hydrolases family 38 N-terminal domain